MKCPKCGTEEYYVSLFASGGKGECVNLYCEHYDAEHARKVQECKDSLPPVDVSTLDYDDSPQEETHPGDWRDEAARLVEDLLNDYLDDKATFRSFQRALYRAAKNLEEATIGPEGDPRADLFDWCAPRDCSPNELQRLSDLVQDRMIRRGYEPKYMWGDNNGSYIRTY